MQRDYGLASEPNQGFEGAWRKPKFIENFYFLSVLMKASLVGCIILKCLTV